MPDNQNKGIGRYKDRPGYFMGGMIGGAILGALVNKVQGKDWKRGALFGGLTGGFMGSQPFSKMVGGMKPGFMKNLLSTGMNPGGYAGITNLAKYGGPMAAAYLADDPEKSREDQEAAIRAQLDAHRQRNLSFYDKWYTNPWTGESMSYKSYNSGGIANARKGFYNGGGAWSGAASDEEVLGSEQDRILSITGQSGLEGQQGLEDITETFEMSSGPDPNDMSGWHEMFLDLQGKGEIPGDWDFNDFMQNLGALDISPTDFSARGGYKTRPGYADAGPVDMPYDPEEEDKTYLERIIEKLLASEMLNTPNRVGRTAIDEWEQSEFNTAKWLQKVPVLRDIMDKEIEAAAHKRPMAFRAEGGIADLDMTGGGASFGPGTGTSDDIPAMLSDGEFVVTAKAVENLGGGDRMTGARRMYQMMNQLDPASQTPAEMSTVGIA